MINIEASDGTAVILAGAALRWIVASGTWAHGGRPEAQQRRLVLTTLANMASKGHIGRGEDIAGYRTWPPGCQPPDRGVVPVIAGGRPGQR